jgi:hypothetical protein
MDERKIGAQGGLEQVILSVDLDLAFTLFHHGAHASRGEDPAEPETTSADALDERALRHEIDGDLAGDHLLLSLGIKTDVTCDHPAD